MYYLRYKCISVIKREVNIKILSTKVAINQDHLSYCLFKIISFSFITKVEIVEIVEFDVGKKSLILNDN